MPETYSTEASESSAPPAPKRPPVRPNGRTPWWLPGVVMGLLLSLIPVGEALLWPLRLPEKGSRARVTLRAPYDFVFNLHESQQEEIREELGRYLPIYDLDTEGFERRRQEISVEAALSSTREPPPSLRDGGSGA